MAELSLFCGRLLELKGVADALGLEFDLWKFCKKEK